MDFKSLISQLDQLNEAEGKTVHKGTYGTSHGKEDVRDQYGHKIGKVNKDVETDKEAPKKGRGRPKKGADETGEVKKYDFSAFGVTKGKDVKLPKYDKKKTKKHSIKEYLEQMYKPLNEEGITVKPMPGASQIIGADGKPMGTADAATANMIKQASEKGTLKFGGEEGMDEGVLDTVKSAVGLGKKPPATTAEKNAAFQAANKGRNMPSSGNASVDYDRFTGRDKVNEKDIGKHNNATTGFDAMVRKLTPKYGIEAAKRIAGSQMKKIKEADIPSDANDMGAGLGAGRSQGVLEGKKGVNPFAKKDDKKKPAAAKNKKPDDDNDGVPNWADKKPGKDDNEGKKKGAAPKKGVNPFAKKDQKKKVKEGMEQSLQAARLAGKSHGLKGNSHCGKNYEDMEEARMYHEGYKEGLDECYGQMGPAVVGEADIFEMPPATVGGMADDAMGEGNAFTTALARTPKGDKFSVGGKTFTDRTNYDSRAFESLDSQLNALLEGKVDEGMTVSISKGQQGSPDSVSVTAQDGEADQLLSVIKQAGLGLFGGDDAGQQGQSSAMSLQPTDGGQQGQPGEMEIDVVDDHDGMMDLIRKVTGAQPAPAAQSFGGDEGGNDYEDEEGQGSEQDGEQDGEESTEEVDEVESYDQEEEQVAEDNPPDSGAAETTADENAEAAEDQALATAMSEGGDGGEASEETTEMNEWANDAGEKARDFDDESFKTDMDFMTKVISGGLNKEKATGQSTVPVVSTQISRLGNPMQESVDLLHDWKKLSGIK
jgi:hypothetical protein